MTYSGELVMPTSYVEVAEEEMTYLDGGYSIAVNRSMLNKRYCLTLANYYASAAKLTLQRCAKEIYAHAFLYFTFNSSIVRKIANAGIATSTINYIRIHSKVCDIGGDSSARVAAFNVIWALF